MTGSGGALRRAPAFILLALPLAAPACAHSRVATVPRAATLAAVHAREAWIVERLRAMREAERADGSSARAIRAELEAAGVDWASFLTPIRGSTSGARRASTASR